MRIKFKYYMSYDYENILGYVNEVRVNYQFVVVEMNIFVEYEQNY